MGSIKSNVAIGRAQYTGNGNGPGNVMEPSKPSLWSHPSLAYDMEPSEGSVASLAMQH